MRNQPSSTVIYALRSLVCHLNEEEILRQTAVRIENMIYKMFPDIFNPFNKDFLSTYYLISFISLSSDIALQSTY